MKDELITFQTAMLAKDYGFDEKVHAVYFPDEPSTPAYDREYDNHNEYEISESGVISAPTQALLQRWLMEKHNMYVLVLLNEYPELPFKVMWGNPEVMGLMWLEGCEDAGYSTYQEALESGLQNALRK